LDFTRAWTGLRTYRKAIVLVSLGFIIMAICLSVSQLNRQTEIASGSRTISLSNETPTVSLVEIFLKLDDNVEILTHEIDDQVPVIVTVSFLGRPSISSTSAVNASLSWICNGDQNYTIDVRFADTAVAHKFTVTVDYEVTRGDYYVIWLFPVGLVAGSVPVLLGLNSLGSHSVRERDEVTDRTENTLSSIVKRVRNIDYLALFLLVIFLAISLLISVQMLHNDEIGGGRTDNWGYYAWGYVDTCKQVAGLLKQVDLSYDSWHAVQNMSKPVFSIYLEALFLILLPWLDPVTASRLFVQMSAAFASVIVYLLARSMFNRKTGILASLLLFFDPVFLHYTRTAYLEGPFVLFMSLFFLFLYKATLQEEKFVYLAGLALGLAVSTKSAMFFYLLVPLSLIWFLIKDKNMPFSKRRLYNALMMTFKATFVGIIVFFIHWPLLWIDPISKLSFQGMFFGLLGRYGPGFDVPLPELFLGRITQPYPLIQATVYLIYQTTYIELVGFLLGIICLLCLRKHRTRIGFIFCIFLFTLASSSILYRYQHRLVYIIWPYTIISAVGYGSLGNLMGKMLSSEKLSRLKFADIIRGHHRDTRFLYSGFLVFVIVAHLTLVMSVAPYYGLYYNRLFLGGKQPTEVFQIPEPVYGLDKIAAFIQENPGTTRRILTTSAPHIVQSYLPDYTVMKDHVFRFGDDVDNVLILRSLQFEYVIVSESALQLNPNLPLRATLDKYAQLVLAPGEGDIPFAYLYRIPNISWSQTLWRNDLETADDWRSNTNTDSSSFQVTSDGQLSVQLDFSSGYPPSLWFKLSQQLPQATNLNGASLYLATSNSLNSNVTLTLTILNQYGTSTEAVLQSSATRYSPKTVLFVRLSDLKWKGNLTDFSQIAGVQLTFYNSARKTLETVTIEDVALVL
jgi:hypothetical protein